jgi:PTS system galactitol-specific IIA component
MTCFLFEEKEYILMQSISFDSDLVLFFNNKLSCEEVEKTLSSKLLERGFVKNTYPSAIASREIDYPTAIDTGGYNVAIPHCDIENVNSPAICMGILKQPTSWYRMDDAKSTCEVSLVIMLALNEAHAHLDVLKNIMNVMQNQKLIKKIIGSTDKKESFSLFKKALIEK